MVDHLTRLRQIVEARTKGPWSISYEADGLSMVEPCKAVVRESDADFIALLGTIADEIVDLVEAAEKYLDLRNEIASFAFHGQKLLAAKDADRSLNDVEQALTALKAKLEGLG